MFGFIAPSSRTFVHIRVEWCSDATVIVLCCNCNWEQPIAEQLDLCPIGWDNLEQFFFEFLRSMVLQLDLCPIAWDNLETIQEKIVHNNEFTDRQCQQGEGRGGFVIPQMEFKLKFFIMYLRLSMEFMCNFYHSKLFLNFISKDEENSRNLIIFWLWFFF